MSPRGRAAPALFLALNLAACTGEAVGIAPPEPPKPNEAPQVANISLPTWPPMNKGGFVDVSITDDQPSARVTAVFRGSSVKSLSSTDKSGTIRFFGAELGEGLGDLRVTACDAERACRERRVEKLLVDMTPPDIELESEVVSPLATGIAGDVAVWVRDGWVLGSVEITYQGKTLTHDFPHAYPSTLGVKPDISRVGFPAKSLPTGNGSLVIKATDAAGNASSKTVKLRIDATPPIVKMTEPAAGAKVQGSFIVRVEATDEGGQVPTVDVFVGGSRVLAGVLPSSPFVIDTSTLTPGIHEVRAVARDDAGNESVTADVAIEVLP